MPTDIETLMEMGFPRNRAEKAMAKTSYKGVQLAMDWLFNHQDDPDIDDPFEVPKGHTLSEAPGASENQATDDGQPSEAEGSGDVGSANAGQACSLKCDECGKLLKRPEDAELHAARTGHANFSESTEEIKPLSEEEKAAKLQALQDRLKARRLEKEEQAKKEQVEKEKMRRVQSKGLSEAKQKQQEVEMQKIVAERKKEKEEERLARQRVRDQIEKDKRDRAAKFSKSQETSPTPAPSANPTAAAAVQPTASPQAAKEYDQCRIQVRLTNGQAITHSFGAKEPLAAVRLYIQLHRTDGNIPFTLMTSFPRKVFSEADMDKPLSELGLVPTAVLIVTKVP